MFISETEKFFMKFMNNISVNNKPTYTHTHLNIPSKIFVSKFLRTRNL